MRGDERECFILFYDFDPEGCILVFGDNLRVLAHGLALFRDYTRLSIDNSRLPTCWSEVKRIHSLMLHWTAECQYEFPLPMTMAKKNRVASSVNFLLYQETHTFDIRVVVGIIGGSTAPIIITISFVCVVVKKAYFGTLVKLDTVVMDSELGAIFDSGNRVFCLRSDS